MQFWSEISKSGPKIRFDHLGFIVFNNKRISDWKKYKNRHESIPWKYFEISSIMIVLTDVVFSALANESVPLQ